jgi:hypothetical protein
LQADGHFLGETGGDAHGGESGEVGAKGVDVGSSAMMLMKLLKNNQLNPKRGDIIIFNNTFAEHPATYEFTRKIKKIEIS